MQEITLKTIIKRPVDVVFAFSLDPNNTPKWVDGIEVEEASEYPVKKGTIYRNQSTEGVWNEFEMTDFEENKTFTLSLKNDTFHVQYIFKPVGEDSTEFTYREWVDEGKLEAPSTQKMLDKFKAVIEL